MYEPVLTEYGAFKYNLLKQLNKFIGKVRSHEGFHSDRDVFWILGFRQSSLHHLQTNNKSLFYYPIYQGSYRQVWVKFKDFSSLSNSFQGLKI